MQTRNVVYRALTVVTLLALLLSSVPGTVALAPDSYEEGDRKLSLAPHPMANSVDSAANGWDTQLVVDVDYDIADTSLGLDSSGQPHIAFYDNTNRNLLYAHYDGTNWYTEIVHSTSNTGAFPSIALDSNDHPHIAWRDYGARSVMYGYHDGSSWQIETVSSGSWPRYTSLALDSDDHPHISYFTDVDWGSHPDSLMYARHDGSSWQIEQVNGTIASADTSIFTALTLDALDRPHIAYSNGFDLVTKYAWKDTSWHLDVVYDDGQMYGEVAIALDSSGDPHIAQTDRTRDTLWYFRQDDSSWYTDTLGTVAGTRGDPSIALDASGDVHVGYPDTDGNIKYAQQSGGEWTTETVAAGQAPALVLDAEGVPHVSYYDDVASELRYASRGVTGMLYLPLILRAYTPPVSFPVHIGEAIPSRNVAHQGEVFYTTTLRMPDALPEGGRFYLSSRSDAVEEVVVDDEVRILVEGSEVFSHIFSSEGVAPEPTVVEVERAVMEELVGRTATVEYRDVYGAIVKASEMWLVWSSD